jgi:uncharacterized protein (TIGR03546 family)
VIEIIAKILKALNSEAEPGQISLALCFGMIAGLTPLLSLHNLLILFFVLVLRVNLSTFILAWGLFSGVAYLLDPLFHRIGLSVLRASPLEGLWTALYNVTLCRLESFNNSIVMGSLVFSAVLFIPVYLISNVAIRRYRDHILAWVRESRIMQILKGSKLYAAYQRVSGWGGGS